MAFGGAISQLPNNTSITGQTDQTQIGNVGDRLKVDAVVTVTPTPATFATIQKGYEITVATKTETDLPTATYTVPSGKIFVLTSLSANYDTASPLIIRLKKQTGGTGSFVTIRRLTLKQHGQDPSDVHHLFPFGLVIGNATDIIKITYESALSKGSLWAAFTGIEY